MRPFHRARWIAIEAQGSYVTQFRLGDLYDHVIVSDARYPDFSRIHEGPDMVIICDVLEHLHKDEEATQVIARLKVWSKTFLISVPLIHPDQEPYEGNW